MKVGDKFKTTFNEKTYTAASFFGKSGIEYQTSQEAALKNDLPDDSNVCVKIKETGGACWVSDTVPC